MGESHQGAIMTQIEIGTFDTVWRDGISKGRKPEVLYRRARIRGTEASRGGRGSGVGGWEWWSARGGQSGTLKVHPVQPHLLSGDLSKASSLE